MKYIIQFFDAGRDLGHAAVEAEDEDEAYTKALAMLDGVGDDAAIMYPAEFVIQTLPEFLLAAERTAERWTKLSQELNEELNEDDEDDADNESLMP
jgi:hypothetical protein